MSIHLYLLKYFIVPLYKANVITNPNNDQNLAGASIEGKLSNYV